MNTSLWRFASGALLLGVLLFPLSAQGNPGDDKALADFTKLIQQDPQNKEGYRKRAEFYVSQNQFEKALPDIAKQIELAPTDLDPLIQQGRALRELGRTDEAIASLSKALKIDPQSLVALDQLGATYLVTKSYDLADEKFAQALAVDDQYQYVYLDRAKMRIQQGKRDGALADLNKIIELTLNAKPIPDNPALGGFDIRDILNSLDRASLGEAYFYRSLLNARNLNIGSSEVDRAKVVDDARQAVKFNPRLASQFAAQTSGALDMTNLKFGMVAVLTGAAAGAPLDVKTLLQLGDAQRATYNSKGAIASYTQVLALDPKSLEALKSRAAACVGGATPYKAEEWAPAVADWKKYLALKGNDVEALKELGIAQYNAGLTADGVGTFKQLIKADPENAYLHLMLGLGLAISNDQTGAMAEVKGYVAKVYGDELEKAKANAGNAKTHYADNLAVKEVYEAIPEVEKEGDEATLFFL